MLLAPRPLIAELLDKATFGDLAREHGFPVPEGARIPEELAAALSLAPPLIAKPITRHEAKWRSVGERAKALIGIAHPDFREQLERQACELRLIPHALR